MEQDRNTEIPQIKEKPIELGQIGTILSGPFNIGHQIQLNARRIVDEARDKSKKTK